MNVITLLSGVIGSGKSTFIKENNLEEYTISTDSIRLLLGQPRHTVDSEGNVRKHISNLLDNRVFNLFYKTLDERMLRGEYIVVDAMNISSQMQNEIKKIAKKHRYRVNIVDIQGDMPLETILEYNERRVEYKVVPEKEVKRTYYKRLLNLKERGRINISGLNEIPKESLKDTFYWKTSNLDSYEKVFVIGDIHGCYTALKEGLGEINDNYFYVFLGDFFDRGIENKEVFLFIYKLMKRDNAVFLTGNHEEHLINYLKRQENDSYFVANAFLNKTLPEILSGDDVKTKDLNKFVSKLQAFFAFEYQGKKYICTHGGILPEQYKGQDTPEFKEGLFDIVRECSRDIIHGIGDYNFDIDYYFNQKQLAYDEDNRVIQFHGHRNSYGVPKEEYEYCYNLENNVELGGHLRIAVISREGLEVNEIKNTIFNKELLKDSLSTANIENLSKETVKKLLESSKHIRKSRYKDYTSFNFTEEVFRKEIWNTFTLTARGLMLKENGDILARGYNKFFNLEQRNETKLENLKESIQYPLEATVKENGFLALLSVDDNGKLRFFSKSGETDYGKLFQNIFYKKLKENNKTQNMKEIISLLKKENVTIAFECVDIENDKHIVTYKESKLVILDAIHNEYALEFKDETKEKLAELTGFEMPEKTILNNEEDFLTFLDNASQEVNTEGYVFKDANLFMFKLKNSDYLFFKKLRIVITLASGRGVENKPLDFSRLPNWITLDENIIQAIEKIKEKYNPSEHTLDVYTIREWLEEK